LADLVFFPSVGEYPAYDDAVYDGFDGDDDRNRAYGRAVRAVASGKIVLDLGTGRDALWAVEAARAGARHVYAVEAQPAVAARARDAVARAGVADRVTVIDGDSSRVELPERASVCVSEVVGNIASAEGVVAVLADARRRLCTPDCVWIPFRCQTWAAAVDLTRMGSYAFAPEGRPYLAKVFAAVGHPFDVRLCVGGPVAETVISSAAPVESLVFDNRRPLPPDRSTATVDLVVRAAAARLTGLLLWARVACASDQPEVDALTGTTRAWAPLYAPLSLDGVPVRAGDPVRVSFARTPSDDHVHPDCEASVRLATSEPLVWSSPHHGRAFRATDLYRRLFPPDEGQDSRRT
jgi:protein arginine N-methyltransferase 1